MPDFMIDRGTPEHGHVTPPAPHTIVGIVDAYGRHGGAEPLVGALGHVMLSDPTRDT
jgi:hypothetical protein